MNSILLLEGFSTITSTEKRGLTLTSNLYDTNSKSPSGGINDIILSFSNLDSLTQVWNFMSSNSIALERVVRPYASKNALSFRPSFSSGIPIL